ncbi:hypothetical protein ABZZ04_37310 [Streptomyces sp. NPDC006435]|uniref:hypothetical protein n=1 Tax=Streptomyces sp. NPDC006435 TaxID=3154300 RepID=UPI0033A54F9D
MHHPTNTPTGPADLALPLALVLDLVPGRAASGATGPDRVPEVRTPTGRGRRAARRRTAAVRG